MTTSAAPGRELPPYQDLLGPRTAFAVGVVGALATTAVAGLPEVGLALGCVGIVVLYAVYPGLSLRWGTASERAVEWSYLAVGAASIALAVASDERWLAAGWAAHGVWDLLHHHRRHVVGMRGIPRWYIDACLVWDFVAAAGLVIVLS